MDDAIRTVLALDASIEEKLQASRAKCKAQMNEAHARADAIRQARRHETQDAIFEMTEAARISFEEERVRIQTDYAERSEALEQFYRSRWDSLLDTLFRDTLKAAEE